MAAAPGGGTDFMARLVGQKLAETLGQQVIVDNRPGAGSTLGFELGVRAAPDGYTLNMITPSWSINPSLYPLKFDAGQRLHADPARRARSVRDRRASVAARAHDARARGAGESEARPDHLRQQRPGRDRASRDRALPAYRGHQDDARAVQGRRARAHRSHRGPDPARVRDAAGGAAAGEGEARARDRRHDARARHRRARDSRPPRNPACPATKSPTGTA